MKNKPVFTTDWFTQSEHIFENYLSKYKGKPDLKFLEIGTWEGRSALWFLENVLTDKTSRITLVDDFGGINNVRNVDISTENLRKRLKNNLKEHEGKYSVYDGMSIDALKYLVNKDNEYDCIYVDGGHDAETCLFDVVFSFSMLKRGGLMFIDDYLWNYTKLPAHKTPKVAIDSFMECMRGKINVLYVDNKTVVIVKL